MNRPPTSVHGQRRSDIEAAGGAGGARTHDRRIMRSTAPRTERPTCTDDTDHGTDGTDHAGIIWRAGPRTGPRPRHPGPLVLLLCVTSPKSARLMSARAGSAAQPTVFKSVRGPRFAAAPTWTFSIPAFYLIHDHPVHLPRGQRLESRASSRRAGRLASRQYRSSALCPEQTRSPGSTGPIPLAITMTASGSPSAGPQASAYADPGECSSTANRRCPAGRQARRLRGPVRKLRRPVHLLIPYPGRSTPIIRTPAAVSSPGGNKQPGIGRELDLPWKAKNGTPSGSPLFPVRYL